MAIKGRVIKLETKTGMQLGKVRRQKLALYQYLSRSTKSIEELHEEVPLDFRGLPDLLEELALARKERDFS